MTPLSFKPPTPLEPPYLVLEGGRKQPLYGDVTFRAAVLREGLTYSSRMEDEFGSPDPIIPYLVLKTGTTLNLLWDPYHGSS
jgi:hypothetical protein